jgi:hypothetical protein
MSGKKRGGYEGASLVCPHCAEDARFINRRGKSVQTLMGPIELHRPYYHCAACHRGTVPWDQSLGLNDRHFSRAAQELVALVGTLVSFPKGSEKTLQKMSGLRVSESTVQRTTEDAGARLKQLWEDRQTLGPPQSWDWQCDAQGRTCGYVSVDAISVRQQGPGGSKADGRMAYVAKLYSPSVDEQAAPPDQVRYLAGLHPLEALGSRLRRQAAQIGWDETEQQIALSDGGAGLEDFFRVNFPRAVRIIDFWHVKEYLVEFASAWFGADETARQSWLDQQCHRLKHEGGAALLVELESLNLRGRSAAVRESHRVTTQYFRNHVQRMDYPTYRQAGWQIGSGPVEAACKTVVAERLKCSGMRWSESGADAVCQLRALWLSERNQWETLWRDRPN